MTHFPYTTLFRSGILRVCGELFVAAEDARQRDAGAGGAVGTEPAVRRSIERRNGGAEPAAGRLQARGRVSGVGEGFSADGVAEDQARRVGGGDWGGCGAGGSSGDIAVSLQPSAVSRAEETAASFEPWGEALNVNETFLAIINPAAGGGRCGERVGAALDRLRAAGIALETAETNAVGHATQIAREAYGRGYRKFLAVGGDGTSYEIVNGLFPDSLVPGSTGTSLSAREDAVATLGFLPLGTGNSFLRDFEDGASGKRGLEHAIQALEARRSRPCDVMRLTHKDGAIYYTNLVNVG